MTDNASRPLRVIGHSTAGPLYEMPQDGEGIFVASDGSLRVAALSTTPTDTPVLTQAEEDELVKRINANPNLHPVALTDTDEDGKLVATYRDIFAEITAKAQPLCDDENDPEKVTGYKLPVGPLHRASGKLSFQMFNGEAHLAAASARIDELERIAARLGSEESMREALEKIAHEGELSANEYGCANCNAHADIARAALSQTQSRRS